MRSTTQTTRPWLAVPMAVSLLLASCGDDSGDTATNDPASAAQETSLPPESADETGGATLDTEVTEPDELTPTPLWEIRINGGHVTADPEETICLKIPGGTFSVSGGGDNGFGADFFFSLTNEGGNELDYEVAGNKTIEIRPDRGGEIDIDWDEDSGGVVATGMVSSGVLVSVTGTC